MAATYIKQYHGIVFSRNGRVIDVQSRTPWTTFINNDRYIRIEVEFSASLDEAFGVTTSKQQVTVSPEMWDCLREAGLPKAIEHLRAKVRTAKAERQRKMAAQQNDRVAHGTAPENIDNANKPSVVRPPARYRPYRRDELILIMRATSEAKDEARALSTLLTRVERRMGRGGPEVVAEYDRLLRGWSREMSRISRT